MFNKFKKNKGGSYGQTTKEDTNPFFLNLKKEMCSKYA